MRSPIDQEQDLQLARLAAVLMAGRLASGDGRSRNVLMGEALDDAERLLAEAAVRQRVRVRAKTTTDTSRGSTVGPLDASHTKL